MRALTLLPLLLLACQGDPSSPASSQVSAPIPGASVAPPADQRTDPSAPQQSIGTRHAMPLARAEHSLLQHAATGDPGHLNRAATVASRVIRDGERHDYPRFLLALVRETQGENQAAQVLLDQTNPDRRHFWARFFAHGLEPALPYLAANLASACSAAADALGPACADAQPTEPPPDYRAFEQASWIRNSRDRMVSMGLEGISPAQLFERLGIQPGMDVLDLGAGDGWFAVPLARQLGAEGTLWANEIHPGLVDYLGFAAAHHGLANLHPVLGTADEVGVEDASVDRVFACDVLHLAYQRSGDAAPSALLTSIHRALRPGGQLLVIDSGSGIDSERLTQDLASVGMVPGQTQLQPAAGKLVMVFDKTAEEPARP
jgi:ubiquinone/menaquinone biosynthesis C-methylase UbiE